MLYARGIMTIVMNAGIDSAKSSRSISLIGDSMNRPTMTSTGVVAAAGIERNTGAKNNAITKHIAVAKAVRPVRPPCATPDALSTYVVVVLAPRQAPVIVAMASAMKALFSPGMRPSFCIIPALVHTPTSVPMVSNMSMKRNVNTTISISIVKIWWNSNLQNIGAMDGGVSMMPLKFVMPIGIPMSAVARIPMSSEPGTFLITSTEVMIIPITPSRAEPPVSLPMVTNVAEFSTMMPAFLSPMKAMNSPMPAPMARLSVVGIASTMRVRIFVTVISTKRNPSMRMAVSANCHE